MRGLLPLILLLLAPGIALAGDKAAGGQANPMSAKEAEQVAAESRDFLTDMLWMKAEDYWHIGKWDDDIRLCRQIIQLDPHFVEAYTGAAYLLYSLDRDEEAIELFRAGMAANAKDYDLPHEFGMYYCYRHKWELAIEQFEKSVSLGAPRVMQHMLPNTLERAGRLEEALQRWEEILKRWPDDPIAKGRIEGLKTEIGRKREQSRREPMLQRPG